MGTVNLVQLRRAHGELERTVERLTGEGIDVTVLQGELDKLARAVVVVPVPCLVCRTDFPVPVTVAGTSIPRAALCGACGGAIDAEVRTSNVPVHA